MNAQPFYTDLSVFIWQALIFICLVYVAYTDICTRRIKNLSVLAILILGVGYRLNSSDQDWLFAIGIGLLTLLVGLLFWQKHWLGGGDVKLLAVCSFITFPHWQSFIFITALGAGALAAVLILKNNFYPSVVKPSIPLGVSIAISCGYVLL